MKTSTSNNIESKNQVFNSRKEQYEAIKYGRPWYLLLFRLGLSFAAYEKDAETVAEVLAGENDVITCEYSDMKCTMFPVDALEKYLPMLRARNEYISICSDGCKNGIYSRRTLADILNRHKENRSNYGECTDVFTSRDDKEQADVKAEGCDVVRHIYYRIDCPDYEAGHDIDAFYSEVVKLLEAEGWHVEGDWQGADCPTMRKGAQSLYCHPQSLSGEVSPKECDRIAQVLMTGETFRLHGIDDYGRIFLTTSDENERDLYRQNYQDGLADMLRELLTTKRSNLFKDKGDVLGTAYRRTAIENIRTDMEDGGVNYYYWRKAVTELVNGEYDRLLQAGYIKETKGQNDRTLARWINKKEERELAKAKREAEKAAKEREAATLKQASEITDIPAADLVWDEDKEGVKVWGNIESHRDNLERMGGRRGRVVFTNNKTGLPTGADCYTFRKDREADIREYVSKTHDRISRDFSETRDKHGERGHEYHEGERVVTVYGRGTVVKTDCWHATDLIDVRLDAPTYNYIWSLAGTPQRRVAVNRDNIVSIELPEPPKEVTISDEQSGKAEREDSEQEISDFAEAYCKPDIVEAAEMGVTQSPEHEGKRIVIRAAYKNGHNDPEGWTYCVSWYDGKRLVECENGVTLNIAAEHMARFEKGVSKGMTLQQILYPAA